MFRFIKAINPLLTMMVNLPCLMVSRTNFLRPTCSYTECPLSFLTGSCPTETTTAGYSSCLYPDFTDLPIPQGTDIPWTLTLTHFAGLCDDAVPVTPHPFRVSFQNPARFRNHPQPGRALEYRMLLTVLCHNRFLLFHTSDVHQHLLRIINYTFLQNRVDYP